MLFRSLDNRDLKLKPNMFAKVVIHRRGEVAQRVIPKDALIRTGQIDRAVLALAAGGFSRSWLRSVKWMISVLKS